MFRIPSIRAHVEATPKDVVLAVLHTHQQKEATLVATGATADVALTSGFTQDALAAALVERASIPRGGIRQGAPPLLADIVHWKGGQYLFLMEAMPAPGVHVELHALGAKERVPTAQFEEALTALLGKNLRWKRIGESLSWLDDEARAALAALLKESTGTAAVREDIAQVLQAADVRRCLASLRHGHVVLPQPGREHDVLTFAGLAKKQFGLCCSRVEADKPLMTFDEEEHVRLLFDAKARCPRCNEPFTRNDLRVLYTLTEEGAAAMTQPHWLLHPLFRSLTDAGARVDALPMTRTGRSLSAIAYCGGWTVAIQVFDRDVAQDDMLRFSEACLEIQPDHVAVVTTGEVRREAKELLEDVLVTGPQAQIREIGYFERFSHQNAGPLVTWWNELEDRRLLGLLESHAFPAFRHLGLSPSALARAAVETRGLTPRAPMGPKSAKPPETAVQPPPAVTVPVADTAERKPVKAPEPVKPGVKR